MLALANLSVHILLKFGCWSCGYTRSIYRDVQVKRESYYACYVLLGSFHMHQVYQNICSNAQNDMGQKPRHGKM